MGKFEQHDIKFDLSITKNGSQVFQGQAKAPYLDLYRTDTLKIESSYEPVDIGKYEIEFNLAQEEQDDFPQDNIKIVDFLVTDSIYSRAGSIPDHNYSLNFEVYQRDDWDLHANLGHFMGSVFPIYAECEVDGIAVYITGGLADGQIEFRYTIWKDDYFTGDFIDPYLLMETERVVLDSSMFNQWIYLPIYKDGETEFLEPGFLYYAGVEYNNWHEDELIRKNYGLSIGATRTTPIKLEKPTSTKFLRYHKTIQIPLPTKPLLNTIWIVELKYLSKLTISPEN